MTIGAAATAVCLTACGNNGNNPQPAANSAANSTAAGAAGNTAAASSNSDAQNLVTQSVGVVQKMEQDPGVLALLKRAKGVLILPDYGKGGLIVGGHGGEGVLLVRTASGWSDPVFYNTGGVSLGAQAGGEGGSVALILMTDKALTQVRNGNNFSLNAKSGLSVANYSAEAKTGTNQQDVVIWTNLKGAYAGANISVSDISRDTQQTQSYYPGAQNADRVLAGEVHNPAAQPLVSALPAKG
jgi:lipid-binding SYLF domain-containing protein